ncbi:MAG TPA: hypothetical protein V6C97_15075 [Oculatellaceae cyanobacterium]
MKTKMFAIVVLVLCNGLPAFADDWDFVPAAVPQQADSAASSMIPASVKQPVQNAISQIQSATGFDVSSLTDALPMPNQVSSVVQPVLDEVQPQQQPSTTNQTPDGLPQCTTCTLAAGSSNGLPKTSLAIISNQ